MSQYQVTHGDYGVSYSLESSERKTLTINVLPDLSVIVKAPEDASHDIIEEKVKKRIPWIIKQQDYFKQFLPHEPPRNYVSGETHRYLGRQYRLKVVSSEESMVKLKGKYFFIYSQNKPDSSYNKQLLYSWYKQHSTKYYNRIIAECSKKLRKYGIQPPVFEIRPMKKRWGSSDPEKGIIRLNADLIKAPIHCIEYVVTHEMIHLKYPYHDKKFYNMLTLVMPEWKERKNRLELVTI